MNIGAFITVRLGSTRLPNKALLKIKGEPTIILLIKRIKHADKVDKIVLCTTTNPKDKKLIKLAKQAKINYFTGDEKDIIKRHYDAANFHAVDFIINIDGDDLFCDPEYINEIAEEARKNFNLNDVIITEGLPIGVNSFGYKKEVLKKIFEEKEESNTETGWGEYFKKDPSFKIKIIKAKEKHSNISARMTLDYHEDFEFFKSIYDELYKKDEYFSLDHIINLLNTKPNLLMINKRVEEKYWKNYENKKVLKKNKM